MVELIDVTKRYGAQLALNGLSLNARPGSCLALWGHNGAGKSTALKCILQLVHYEGKILIAGDDIRRHGVRLRRQIGYVPQELAQWDMTTGQAMEFFGALKRVPKQQVLEPLQPVGLSAEVNKPVTALSGGMRQRLALALALLGDPPLLLLDEPTASLDEGSRGEFLTLLKQCRQAGKTILFSSHRPEEIVQLADTVAMLEQGKLLRLSRPEDLLKSTIAAAGTPVSKGVAE